MTRFTLLLCPHFCMIVIVIEKNDGNDPFEMYIQLTYVIKIQTKYFSDDSQI
jgi:hypothetical protein